MRAHSHVYLRVFTRWFARMLSLLSSGLMLAMIFGESLAFNNWEEVIGFICFPIGIWVGMALGWKSEWLGGSITIVSLVGFYVWHLAASQQFPSGPYFVLFASPGILFFLLGLLDNNKPLRNHRQENQGCEDQAAA